MKKLIYILVVLLCLSGVTFAAETGDGSPGSVVQNPNFVSVYVPATGKWVTVNIAQIALIGPPSQDPPVITIWLNGTTLVIQASPEDLIWR